MPPRCVLATLGDDPHTQGLFRVARIAQKAGIKAHVMPMSSPLDAILERIHQDDPAFLGFSYRLSPEVAVKEYRACLHRLAAAGLLNQRNGQPRRVALAGLPDAMRGIEHLKTELPCDIWTMQQDTDLMRACARVLDFFNTPSGLRASVLAELKPEFFPPRFRELDEMATIVVQSEDYRNEPPLPVPTPAAQASYIRRIQEMDMPLLRSHYGTPAPTIAPTVEGIRKLAEARVIDEVSLGSSDLSQRYFGDPAAFVGRKNDGGVPYSTEEHLVELAQASRRGNFPGVKPYAHVTNLVPFVDTCIRTGMLYGTHQAVPLYWFNQLDGRGPTPVRESIIEHQATVKALARHGIPVEMNDPNHFSSRWAPDTIIAVDYALITAVMLQQGVKDLIFQMQFNKPREASDHGDLAKMLAGMDLAEELIAGSGTGARMWRETRTGIDSFPPDLDQARHQLARSTFLQLLMNPHIIHLVSYCEALYIAGTDDIIDSSRLIRRCVRVFREHAPDLLRLRQHPLVVERRAHLVREARTTLRAIAGLLGGPVPANAPLPSLIPRLANPDNLIRALEVGVMAAPGIFHPAFPAARNIVTAPVTSGFIEALDPETGKVLPEAERLANLSL
jgi:hypothetical protein